MSACDPLFANFFYGISYTPHTGSRCASKQTNEWLRGTMKKLGIASLDGLSTMTRIDRGSLFRYFSQDRRHSIDAIVPICTALGVTADEPLIVLGAADNADKKQ
jgi:hypothetical protein